MSKSDTTSPADQTRTALILAALRLFGERGFEGTSTREIAAAANANIGSIAYHFGSKDGLRMAAAEHVIETIGAVANPVLGAIDQTLDAGMTPGMAEAQLQAVAERMVGFIVARPEAGEIVQFVLRELAQPTPALDRIYAGLFEPIHKRLCRIWEQATGEPAESEQARLTTFSLIGQVIYFRIGRIAVERRMGWEGIGPREAAEIVATIKANISAIAASRRKERAEL